VILNKQRLAEPPIYPCYKGEGLCDMRIVETDKFQCVYDAGTCLHRKVIKAKSEEGETSKLWDSLGRRKEKSNATVPSVQREGDYASPT